MELSRRDFLKALGIGTAGAAAGVKAEMPSSAVEKPEVALKPVAYTMVKGDIRGRVPVYRIEVDTLEMRAVSMGFAPLSERGSANTHETVVGFSLSHESYNTLAEHMQRNRAERMNFEFVVRGEVVLVSAYLKEFNMMISYAHVINCTAVFEDAEILA